MVDRHLTAHTASRVGEFSAGLWNRAAKRTCRLNPFIDGRFGVRHGFGIRLTVGHAARQFRHFDDEAVVFFAPVMISS
jgi:hypothetical protein